MENRIIFEYNNVKKPFLLIRLCDGEKISNLGLINFNVEELENNLPIYDDLMIEIDRFLSEKEIERKDVLIVLNCNETRKITTILPYINERKTKKIYDVDLVNRYPEIDTYDRVSVSTETENNRIYYEYIVEKNFREYFESFGKDLGFTNVEVEHSFSYLFNNIMSKVKQKTFAYFYEHKGITTLLVVVEGALVGYSSFESTETNYRLNVASIIDKHIYDLEKANIETVYANKNIECLQELNPIVRNYVIGG